MDRSRPSDLRSMNPKYCVNQNNATMFFLVALFQYFLPLDMAASTAQYNSTFEVFLETVAFWCFVIRLIDTEGSGDPSPSLCCSRERTCFFSLLFYRQNPLLLSATLGKTCCFSLLLYRKNLLFSLSSRDRTCCVSLFYFADRASCFSLLLYKQSQLLSLLL